jgi:DNA polymerase-1
MTATASISRPLRKLLAAGPAIYRNGNTLMTGDACPAELLPELEALCLPRVSEADGKAVVALLKEHAGRVRYVVGQEEAVAVVAELMQAEALAFDVETAPLQHYRSPVPIAFTKAGALRKRQPTTGVAGLALDPHRSRVRLVSVFGGTDAGAVVFDIYKLGWNALAPLWTKPLIAANATFDARRLMEEAQVPPTVVFDVLRVAALTHGLVGQSASLASVTRDVLNIVLPKGLAVSDWGAEPLSRAQLLYSALDAVVTFLIHQAQEHELSRQGRQQRRLMGACVVPVCEMERAGLPLDRNRHQAQIDEWNIKLPQLRAALNAASGDRDLETRAGLQDHLNAVIPTEEREMWPTTSTGLLKTDKLTLKLNRYIPGLNELLVLRAVKTLSFTFGESLIERLNPTTGRLHPSFRIGSTIAGRFSSAGPNIQQQPARNKAFRSIFKAPEGSSIISCDYAQIELRVLSELVRKDLAGFIGQNEPTVMDGMFRTGEDIHWQTAKRMYLLPDDASQDDHPLLRANAKNSNFALCYGMGLETFYKRLRGDRPELTIVEADEIRQAWLTTFYDVALWQKLHSSASRRQGYVETRLGRRWYWTWRAMDPETLPEDIPFRDDLLVGFSKPLSLNFPIQGSASEVMSLALVNTHRALKGSRAKLIASVHDELVLECTDRLVDEVKALVVASMTAAFVRLFPVAPIEGLVDAASGPSWGELA